MYKFCILFTFWAVVSPFLSKMANLWLEQNSSSWLGACRLLEPVLQLHWECHQVWTCLSHYASSLKINRHTYVEWKREQERKEREFSVIYYDYVSNFNQKNESTYRTICTIYPIHQLHTHTHTPFFNLATRSARFCGFSASRCITLSLRLREGREEPVPPPEDDLFAECFNEPLGGGGRGWTGRFGLRTAGERLLSAGCVRIFFDFDWPGRKKT